MKRINAGGKLAAWQVLVLCSALAQMVMHLPAQTRLPGGAGAAGPELDVWPKALDFGLVGMGRTSNLTFQVKNVGAGTVKGEARVKVPFQIDGGAYSLKSGETQSFTIHYSPKSARTDSQDVTFSGARAPRLLASGTGIKAGTPPPPPQNLRVVSPEDVRQADFIVRYNDEATSYVLKPPMRETFGNGSYWSIYTRQEVAKLAAGLPRRTRAIIVLSLFGVHSSTAGAVSNSEDSTKEWRTNLDAFLADLENAGYRHLIVCRSKKDEIVGRPIQELREAGIPRTGG